MKEKKQIFFHKKFQIICIFTSPGCFLSPWVYGEPSRGLGRCLTKPRSIQGQEGNCLKGRVQGDQGGSGTWDPVVWGLSWRQWAALLGKFWWPKLKNKASPRLPSALYLASLDCVEEKHVMSNAVICQGGQEACVGYTYQFSLGLLHGVV